MFAAGSVRAPRQKRLYPHGAYVASQEEPERIVQRRNRQQARL